VVESPDKEGTYFKDLLRKSDTAKREQILKAASPEMARSLSAQWVKQEADIARAEGEDVPELGEGGRLYTEQGVEDWKAAKTGLGYGDFIRSKEIAEFFHQNHLKLPDEDAEAFSQDVDYEDVKLKIIQQEGLDMHDFNIFDDRASRLWRKPWTDGIARELTSGDNRSTEELRDAVEQMIVNKRDKNPKSRTMQHPSHVASGNIRIDVDEDNEKEVLKDIRKNQDQYQED
jgi:hypothetical protein